MKTDYHTAIRPIDKSPLKVFVKFWSGASVTCVPYPQTSTLQQLGLWDHNYHYHASWKCRLS